MCMVTRQVFYTADLITPDGSDTDVYGDSCEVGHGATLTSGWVSPDWSRWDVYENKEDVKPDVYANDDGDVAEWLARVINDRLGAVEGHALDTSWYAVDADENYTTGVNRHMAAHPEGFTNAELYHAFNITQRKVTA